METEKNINQEKIDYFIKRVKHYFFNVFHMYDFELEISNDANPDARATTLWYDIEDGAGMITIAYNEKWFDSKDATFQEIDKVAFHETCEALLSELQQLLRARFIDEKDIPNAVHRVIRRLENTIYNTFLKDGDHV